MGASQGEAQVQQQYSYKDDCKDDQRNLEFVHRIVAMHFARIAVDDELVSLDICSEYSNPKGKEDEFEHQIGIAYILANDTLVIASYVIADVVVNVIFHLLFGSHDTLGKINGVYIGGEASCIFG